jgi:hypothetical protein
LNDPGSKRGQATKRAKKEAEPAFDPNTQCSVCQVPAANLIKHLLFFAYSPEYKEVLLIPDQFFQNILA